MWCRKVVTNPQISIPLVMIRVKAALLTTFLQAMLVLVMDLILTFLRAMIVPIVLVKFLGKVAASSNRDLVTSLDMMVSVKDLTTDQVPSSEATAPPCPMLLAPKHQAKAPLSLTQPTIKHTARIRKFLKAPLSLTQPTIKHT